MIVVVCYDSDSETIVDHGLVVLVAVQVHKIDFIVKNDVCSLLQGTGRRNI